MNFNANSANPRFWVVAITTLTLVSCVPPTTSDDAARPWDVRGDYDLSFNNAITLRLDIGGAVRERTAAGWGDIVDFGDVNGKPVTLDLAAHCAKTDVDCPSEVFWSQVAINQPEVAQQKGLYNLRVRDRRSQADGGSGQTLDGLLDHNKQDAFLIGLGAKGGSGGNGDTGCAALAISVADGRFRRDAEGAVDGIQQGRVKLGWLGGCAFGPLLIGATLAVETGYVGTRVGPLTLPVAASATGAP
jgi:hypothetical protein